MLLRGNEIQDLEEVAYELESAYENISIELSIGALKKRKDLTLYVNNLERTLLKLKKIERGCIL